MVNRVQFEITERDLLNFNLYFYHHRQPEARRREKFIAILIGMALGAAIVVTFAGGLAIRLSIAGLFFIVVTGGYLKMMHAIARSHYRRHVRDTAQGRLPITATMELRPDGIWSSSIRGELTISYESIEWIAEHDGATFIYAGLGMAMVLPHDRLDESDRREFVTEVERRRQEAVQA